MAPSRLSGTKKKMGRPRVGSTSINVRLPPTELARLDAWAGAQDDKPSRPEALRRLMELTVQLPMDVIDAWASSKDLTRAQAIRALIDAGIVASVPHTKIPVSSKRRR